MSTLNLENIKHPDSASNNISVDSSGRTGVGTATPSATLHVEGGSNTQMRVSSTGAEANLTLDGGSYSQINNTTGALYVTNNNAEDIYFRTASTTRMTVDGAGRVTMPYQPVFSVYDTNDNENTWTSGTTQRIIFNSTPTINTGSHYSTANSVFTAPVNGVYYFEATVGFYIGYPSYVRDLALDIQKNGVIIAKMEVQINSTDQGSSNAHGGVHVSTYTEASSGDYFEVTAIPYALSGGTLRAYTRVFSGRLVG